MNKKLVLLKEIFGDFFRFFRRYQPNIPVNRENMQRHLNETVGWLRTAAENGSGGVASHYSLLKGKWLDPFPETTGYIIPTILDYAHFSGEKTYTDLAEKLSLWLRGVQLENGACMQGTCSSNSEEKQPLIFNTGQNMLGFLRIYRETGNRSYMESAKKAADFLVNATESNGVWNRALHHGIPHTYNSRTAWALLELNKVHPLPDYVKVALANLDWVVSQQQENGWFRHANFKPGELPNTHGIAYTIRGLLESHLICGDRKYLAAVEKTSSRIINILRKRSVLYTFWDSEWNNHGKYLPFFKGRYSCLTGNAQLAIVWMKLFEILKREEYLAAADHLLGFVMGNQNLMSGNSGIRGGIKGTFPVYGSYSFLKYPNWAAKFFADALLLRLKIEGEKQG